MISPFRKAGVIIEHLDTFFDVVEKSTNSFQRGILSYLQDDAETFQAELCNTRSAEKKADALLKDVEHMLFKYSLLPELRTDVMRLMQRTDDIVDQMKEVLAQFDVERPLIPEELKEKMNDLTAICVDAAQKACYGGKLFFTNPDGAREHINHAIEMEQKADQLAERIKRTAFHDLHNLSLPEKFHIRYFTLHIENVSDIAKSIAYTLNLMLIKRFD